MSLSPEKIVVPLGPALTPPDGVKDAGISPLRALQAPKPAPALKLAPLAAPKPAAPIPALSPVRATTDVRRLATGDALRNTTDHASRSPAARTAPLQGQGDPSGALSSWVQSAAKRAESPQVRTVLVDFDGTLHSGPWEGADRASGAPIAGAKAFLEALLASPKYQAAIFSSRNTQPQGPETMRRWLRERLGLSEAQVSKIDFPTAKPPHHVLVDDRAWAFRGTYPTMAELDVFETWQEAKSPSPKTADAHEPRAKTPWVVSINTAKQVFGNPVTPSQIKGEAQELWEGLRAGDWANVSEEVSDVALFAQVWAHERLGQRLNWPVTLGMASYQKFKARMDVWEDIFKKEGLKFHPRYLVAGGNHNKPEKVRAALDAARRDQPSAAKPDSATPKQADHAHDRIQERLGQSPHHVDAVQRAFADAPLARQGGHVALQGPHGVEGFAVLRRYPDKPTNVVSTVLAKYMRPTGDALGTYTVSPWRDVPPSKALTSKRAVDTAPQVRIDDHHVSSADLNQSQRALLRAVEDDTFTRGLTAMGRFRSNRRFVYAGTELVGVCAPRPSRDDDRVVRPGGVFILPQHRGKGYGAKVLEQITHGRPAKAWIDDRNVASQAAHRKVGMEPVTPHQADGADGHFWYNAAARALPPRDGSGGQPPKTAAQREHTHTTARDRDLELWRTWKSNPTPANLDALMRAVAPVISQQVRLWSGQTPTGALEIEAKTLALDAFRTYDPSAGTALASHVTNRLAKLSRFVYSNQNMVRIPEHRQLAVNHLWKAETELAGDLGRPPSVAELADKLKWSPRLVTKTLQSRTGEHVGSRDEGTGLYGIDTSRELGLHVAYASMTPEEQRFFDAMTGWGGKPAKNKDQVLRDLKITPRQYESMRQKVLGRLERVGV